MNPKLTSERLSRRAIVYIRQSSPGQVIHNQESTRRQYALVDRARELGFHDVGVIDDDLGRTGSGLMERPGFQRLVGEVCTGEIGGIFCIEASRLARNGRDWHHLIELCGMVGAVVIDPDGVYDPALINDRLLLGLKGTMSEFELNLLRQRSFEAIRQKARRGELRYCLPVGYLWNTEGRIEMDPDQRIQHALASVFSKMTELGSVRQVLLWFRRERIELPMRGFEPPTTRTVWALPIYNTVLKILSNPIYAGAYAFGKTCARTSVVEGRARKTWGHKKPREEWTVLLPDHHPGYISWEQYERNQAMIAANAHMKSRMEPKAGRGGKALLAGLLRCRRCGRMLHVSYTGRRSVVLRYHCKGAHINHGEGWCISFGGLRTDQAVADEILHVIGGNAVDAALQAADQMREQRQEQRKSLALEVEQARYESRLAARRYEAVDPDNRLVSAELETRWNAALQKAQALEERLRDFDLRTHLPVIPDKAVLLSLAQDLPAVWSAPTTDMRLKQRIARILMQEIVADVDEEHREIILLIHWAGGQHSELRIKKSGTGKHQHCTSVEAIEVVRQMSGKFADERIATTLNRLGLRTGAGNTWTVERIYTLRYRHGLPNNNLSHANVSTVTLQEAAHRLGISAGSVRRMIIQKLLPATQVVECAPWEIPVTALENETVRTAIDNIKNRVRPPRTQTDQNQNLLFSTTW
jgi:DNA invertase Pin-like site-specific DNA recombinase